MTLLVVDQLEMRFGTRLIQKNVSFKVEKGCIFAVMGGSGCGKSTLLKHLVGLLKPTGGTVKYDGIDYWASDEAQRNQLRSRFGMLFQSAALWSSMSVLENVCLPLAQQTSLNAGEREALGVMGLDSQADRAGLRRRYSELVRRYHPDKNGGDRSHEGKLQRVVEAYQLLSKAAAFA